LRAAPGSHEVSPVDDSAFIKRLRRLLGRECTYLGQRCRLVEILGDEGSLVLESREEIPPIQTDQYGHPNFRANEVIQVPIFGTDRQRLSDELLDLLFQLDTGAGG
jgi:hypothetical protein